MLLSQTVVIFVVHDFKNRWDKKILPSDEEETRYYHKQLSFYEEEVIHDFKQSVGQKIVRPDEEEGCVLQVIANSSPDQVFAAP